LFIYPTILNAGCHVDIISSRSSVSSINCMLHLHCLNNQQSTLLTIMLLICTRCISPKKVLVAFACQSKPF